MIAILSNVGSSNKTVQSVACIFNAGVGAFAVAGSYVDSRAFRSEIDTCFEADTFCASSCTKYLI